MFKPWPAASISKEGSWSGGAALENPLGNPCHMLSFLTAGSDKVERRVPGSILYYFLSIILFFKYVIFYICRIAGNIKCRRPSIAWSIPLWNGYKCNSHIHRFLVRAGAAQGLRGRPAPTVAPGTAEPQGECTKTYWKFTAGHESSNQSHQQCLVITVITS